MVEREWSVKSYDQAGAGMSYGVEWGCPEGPAGNVMMWKAGESVRPHLRLKLKY